MTDATKDLATLTALNARFIHNFVTRDVAGHDAILHPDFLAIGSDGARMERSAYLKRWATAFDPEAIIYWDTRDERITIVDDLALVRATNRHVVRRDGREVVGFTTYTDTYVRCGGEWLCVQAQSTPVVEGREPGDETIVSIYEKGVRTR